MVREAESDNALVRRFQRGDEAAFEQFVERHHERVYRLARVRLDTDSDAADVTQEVFLRAYTGLGRFRFGAAPFTWLYRTTRNVCSEHNRRQRRHQEFEGDVADERPSLERAEDSARAAERVRRLVGELPTRQREVVLLRVFEELSVADTARAMGCRPGTVKALLHKAMGNLRKSMRST